MRTRSSLKLITTTLFATIALLGGACSSGTDTTGKGNDASDQGGGDSALPELSAPDEVIDLVTERLQGKRVQMVLGTDKTALTDSWRWRAQRALEEHGVEFSHTSADWDWEVLAQQLQTAIDSKPDALIVHNADASATASLLQQAQDEGIFVIVVNLASNTQTDAFVGPNWRKMADDLSTRASEDCKAAGKEDVAIITGLGADTGSVLFESGATAAFEREGMNIVANQPGGYDPSQAGEISRTLIQQNPDLCAIVGNWDVMMLGAAKAVADADKIGQVGVYTTDSSSEVCDAIGEGTMKAAINYGGGTTMGDNAASLTLYLLQSGLRPGTARTALFTATFIVDSTNWQDPASCYGLPED